MSFGLLPAFLRRDYAIQLSYRADLTLQTASVLLTLVLFYYISELVDDGTFATDVGGGAGYFGFVVIGLALLRILSSGLNSFAQRLRNDQTSGTLEAMLASPVRASTAILFSAAFDLLRATFFASVMILAAITFFGLRLNTDPLGVLVAAVTLAGSLAVFAALGMLIAAFTVVYKQSSAALQIASTGIGVFSGVYFPLDVFPDGVQLVANLIPMTWAVDVTRSALLEGTIETDRFLLLIGSAVVLLPAALVVIGRAVTKARQQGSLAQY
jgi:ABC-2 type transport system permease protein